MHVKRAPRKKRTKTYTKYGYCPRCGTGYTWAEYHADCCRASCDACRVALYGTGHEPEARR